MKKLYVSVFRDADLTSDCTNNGISARHNRIRVFWDCTREQAIKYCSENNIDTDDCGILIERNLWGEEHPYIEPLIKPKGKIGGMFGGNFVYTSNGIFYSPLRSGCQVAIPIHDRYETQAEYNALSI